MTWFQNLRARNKLLLSFLVVLVFAIGAGIYAVAEMRLIHNDYASMLDLTDQRIQYIFAAKDHFAQARMSEGEVYYPDNTRDDLNQLSAGLDQELDLVIEALNGLHEIAAQAVKEKIESVLPQVEQYRKDSQDTIGLLLAAGEISLQNPDYRAALSQAEEKTVAIGSSYANDMTATIDGMSGMALDVLQNLAATEGAKVDRDLYIVIGIFVVLAILTLGIAFYIAGLISRPLIPLSTFMKKVGASGDLMLKPEDVETIGKYARARDEIGQTMSGAASFIEHVTKIAKELESVANGDLTVDVQLLSDEDTMGKSLQNMIGNLNGMFAEIHASTTQVSTGAKQVAEGAQTLAQGSTEQAATVEELSSSIAEVAQKTKENASIADQTAKLSHTIKENAEKGSRQMDEMIAAVADINDASQSISKIIKTIDDIAFQTNILALNAAVEAARAGQHGKGFAVVAEEVRHLASKSAEAAKDTGHMIQNSMEKAALGSQIAGETATSLQKIVSGINESTQLIAEIASASEEQSWNISQINIGIDQVAQVVQQNSATAEESAAASQEMSGQSDLLQGLIAQFKLKEGDALYPQLPAADKTAKRILGGPEKSRFALPADSSDFGKY